MTLAALMLSAATIWMLPGVQVHASDRSERDRFVAAPVGRDPGTNPDPASAKQGLPPLAPAAVSTSSVVAPGERPARCAALQKRYAKSEACFARYRMINRGLKPGAFKHCKQMTDPSAECGSFAAP
jgi:hypothetical protein